MTDTEIRRRILAVLQDGAHTGDIICAKAGLTPRELYGIILRMVHEGTLAATWAKDVLPRRQVFRLACDMNQHNSPAKALAGHTRK